MPTWCVLDARHDFRSCIYPLYGKLCVEKDSTWKLSGRCILSWHDQVSWEEFLHGWLSEIRMWQNHRSVNVRGNDLSLGTWRFQVNKVISSSHEGLSQIPPQEKASLSVNLNFDELPIEHILSLKSNTETDCFRFYVHSHQTPESTKCSILSCLSTVFNPLGVLAPYMQPAKCLIQSLWHRNRLGWTLDEGDQSIWKDWLEDLKRLSQLELPRFCVNTSWSIDSFIY